MRSIGKLRQTSSLSNSLHHREAGIRRHYGFLSVYFSQYREPEIQHSYPYDDVRNKFLSCFLESIPGLKQRQAANFDFTQNIVINRAIRIDKNTIEDHASC